MRVIPSALLVLGVGLAAPLAVTVPASAAVTCAGEKATIVGNAKDNVIRGTSKRDVIVGGAGNDQIHGMGGDDLICGGDGADTIVGGPGDDRILGELDAYWVDAYGRQLKQGDTLTGGAGNDVLDPGQDARPTSPGAPVTPDGFSYANAPGPVSVDLRANPAVVLVNGSDTLVTGGPLRFIGGDHGDSIVGTEFADELMGGGGDDAISGVGGDDVIHADSPAKPGNDTLSGGTGDDVLQGTAGNDTFYGESGADQMTTTSTLRQTFMGGSGGDTVTLPLPQEPGFVVKGHGGQDRIRIQAHPNPALKPTLRIDQLKTKTTIRSLQPFTLTGTISGFSEVNLPDRTKSIYKGTKAAEIITAHPRARAMIYGRNGADVLIGSKWADRLDGGKGFDIARGKGGKDTCKRVERRSSC
jgi:Ca2+-binding RTX toxin-like protein